MGRYIARTCPKCRDYFGVTVIQRPNSNGEHSITAYCLLCGFQLRGVAVIEGLIQNEARHIKAEVPLSYADLHDPNFPDAKKIMMIRTAIENASRNRS